MKLLNSLLLSISIAFVGVGVFAQDSKFQTAEAIDQYVEAVKAKIEHVKNDSEQHERALKMGWYDQMNGYIKSALLEKERILIKEETE